MFDTIDSHETRSWTPDEGEPNIYNTIRWHPKTSDGIVLACDTEGMLTKFNNTSGEKEEFKSESDDKNPLAALDYNFDGSMFVAGGDDYKVRYYDDETMKCVCMSDPDWTGKGGHINRVFCAKFNPIDKNIVATSGWDMNVIIHDIRGKLYNL